MRAPLLIGIASTAVVVGAGAWLGLRSRSAAESPPPAAQVVDGRVERVPIPEGVSGGAVHVAAHDPVRATCWGDGSVTIRRGASVSRVTPPGGGERYRRVAVQDDGTVFALSTHGGLYDLSSSPAARLPVKGVQAGAAIATDGLWLAIGGESGAIHRVLPGTYVRSYDEGDPSITSIAGLPRGFGFAVGRADGTTTFFAGCRDHLTGRLRGSVVATGGRKLPQHDQLLLAAGDDEGNILVWEAPAEGALYLAPQDLPARAESVGAPIVALFVLPGPEGSSRGPQIAVVHEPATVSLLRQGSAVSRIRLDANPHAACAIEDGNAILVATDAGERIVRFAR